ncbi:MAG: hypothetical protein ACRCTZ_21335, partial [Sarcina sp.]
ENPVIYSYIQKNYNMSNFTLYEMLRGIYDVEFSLSVVEEYNSGDFIILELQGVYPNGRVNKDLNVYKDKKGYFMEVKNA